MAEIKGKFIILCGRLMSLYKKELKEADNELYKKADIHFDQLNPEGWYDTKIFSNFMDKYSEASLTKEQAIVTLRKGCISFNKKNSRHP